MWYDRRNMRIVLYAGAMFVLLGAFLITRDRALLGVLLIAVGIFMIAISFTALWFLAWIDVKNEKRQR